MKDKKDRYRNMTDEEVEKQVEDFRDLDVSPEEERAMIIGAIRAFLPPLIIFFLALIAIVFIFFKIF